MNRQEAVFHESGGVNRGSSLAQSSRPRILFIDNLRWTMIILVISMHAADTYSPLGNWYYEDRRPLSAAALLTFAAWQMYLQSFFMGLLFFIAGYFAPASLERKGPLRFVRERAFRLGLPVLFYMFILGPITEYFCAHSWASTEPTSFAHEWIKHIRNGEFLQENGPLWFCLALLIFSVVYAAGTRVAGSGVKTEATPAPAAGTLAVFALVMAAGRFLIRALASHGTSVLNMDLGDFAQYILMFGAGVWAAHNGWQQLLPVRRAIRWLMVVFPLGAIAWGAILREAFVSGNRGAISGGWHWQSAGFSVWESFTCVAVCVGVLTISRETWNTQGKVQKFLSDNAFAVYVFHPPIVILISKTMVGLLWPPVAKALMLTVLAAVTSFAASSLFFRRIPLLRNIL
jgi:glucans biosynthesis protein C